MEEFEKVYRRLNDAQKQAVDAIDGPVLVVAGPGTGKTQLLSARVAQILRATDTLPQNILCLTFTESGAQNMRDRLTRFIGRAAYDVQIGTYHSFGGDLIRRYPEYFTETRLERPVDELGKRQILAAIVDSLSYRSPLKQTRHHIGDLMTTISEVKRGLLTPDSLRQIAVSNQTVIEQASGVISASLADHTKRLPSKLAIAEPLFGEIYGRLQALAEGAQAFPPFENLATVAAAELATALSEAANLNKTTPLTKWKNSWLVKNAQNQYVLAGSLETARIGELADVLEQYGTALSQRGLYDFDDMILRAISVLETNTDLKYTLQERYQYLLLDEFQDTNAAQLRLVELLCDNPANEGRPNVLAVGDDDQAIYAFQGAQYSNMLDFSRLFRDVLIINLSENYRSTASVLTTAKNVSAQITDTLAARFPDLTKSLVASNSTLPAGTIERIEYTSEIAERSAIADRVRSLIANGVAPSEIAILAPKHKYLEPLVPYLRDVPLRYERRENILDAAVIRQLLTMSKLIVALHDRDFRLSDSYWPEVLSYDFWEFPVSSIWQLSWQAARQRTHWSELLVASEAFRPAALLFLSLAAQVETESLETILDRLIGTEDVATNEADIPTVRSPLRQRLLTADTDGTLYQAVTELTVLRAKLREHEQQRGATLGLADLLAFVAQYEAADEQMVSTSPYSEAADAVQLMTVFKAKGLEFAHVFLVSCQDDVWGNAARGSGNKLTLPANLAPIRHAGASEDERLRIFFVALTRARHSLYLTSHASTYAGKQPPHLKFLDEIEQADGTLVSQILPNGLGRVYTDDRRSLSLEILETNWQQRHTELTAPLKELLRERLEAYRLSPTHLTSFLDLEHAGPQAFLLNSLLRFPSAQTVDLAYGNAVHETMEWLQLSLNTTDSLPTSKAAGGYLQKRLELQGLTSEQLAIQQARGEQMLQAYLQASSTSFQTGNLPEYNFRDEGVVLSGGVRLGGKIDLLQIDRTTKKITIIDYKTGLMGSDSAKLHRYELQLYCYKLLLEHAHSFKDYTVEQASLVFVEPESDGTIRRHDVVFKPAESDRVAQLLTAVWACIQSLDMPDISGYGTGLSAIRQFEADLLLRLGNE